MSNKATFNFSSSKEALRHESLKVNVKKGKIALQVNGLHFIDKDTKQVVVYIPSLDISSYGDTKEKADEMIKDSFDFFCRHLVSLSIPEINKLLSSLGWDKGFFAKQFSKLYVDENGQLQNFNAENNHIERFALTTA